MLHSDQTANYQVNWLDIRASTVAYKGDNQSLIQLIAACYAVDTTSNGPSTSRFLQLH